MIAKEMRVFVAVWSGQVVSLIGSGLTGFAISLWVYRETESVTLFALNAFLNFLPGIILSPAAGVLADRWSRRRVMILADSGAAASTLFIALMFWLGDLALWQIYLATAVNAICNTFQRPAYAAAVSLLVPRKQFTRAGAMLQMGGQVSGLIAPPLAGFLLLTIGLAGIIVIDFSTFLCAIGILLFLRFPEVSAGSPDQAATRPSWRQEALQGWRYLAARPGLRGLLIFSGLNLFLIAVNATLSIPILLTLTTEAVVGLMAFIFGSAGVLGGIVVTAWGGPRRRIAGVLVAHGIIGAGLVLFGLRPNLGLMILAGCILSGALPLRNGLTEAIWRSNVPSELQGRIFALLQVVSATAFGLAYLAVAPLADFIFEPLLLVDGLLAGTIGRLVGVGVGRGMALCVVVAGLLTLAVTLGAFLYRPLRLLQAD